MKNVIKESKPQVEPHVITSQNSPELAQRIRQASAAILKRNYNLYKELENKLTPLSSFIVRTQKTVVRKKCHIPPGF